MKLVVNGTQTEIEQGQTLEQLIEQYELNHNHVVAEVNGDIIDRSRWHEFELQPEVQVELVHFVGGG